MRLFFKKIDDNVIDWVKSWPSWLSPVMASLSIIGQPLMIIALAAAIAIIGRASQSQPILIASAVVVAVVVVNGLIKGVFRRYRPPGFVTRNKLWFDVYSFPSGHTSGSTVGFGLLAYLVWQVAPLPISLPATIFLIILIIGVGLSRIKVGAHYPTDVLAGWLLGLLGLWAIFLV